jgi:hypothetical protein
MADYTQITDFSAKDALPTGNSEKVILGADVDGELSAIATAIASKYDSNDVATQGQAQAEASDAVLITPLKLGNWADYNAGIVGDLQALSDPGADRLLGWDDSASAAIGFSLGTGLAFSGTSIVMSFLGLESLTDPNDDRIAFWDDSAGALAWLDIGNGLTLSGTTLSLAAGTAGSGLDFSSGVLSLTDVSAGAAQPVGISSGTFAFDLSSITEIDVSGLNYAADSILVSDGGTLKLLPFDEAGLKVVNVSDTAQTFALTDANTDQILTGISADRDWTVPTNASVAFDVGTIIFVSDRDGDATYDLTITGASGVTLTSRERSATEAGGGESTHTVTAGGTAGLRKVATDEWMVVGDIT